MTKKTLAKVLLASFFGLLITYFSIKVFSPYFAVVFFIIGAQLPLSYFSRQQNKINLNFVDDYPTVLFASAAGLKSGLTPLNALSRASELLPKNSLVKLELEQLQKKLKDGTPKEKAMESFANNVELPELDLFRSALLLALQNGGKFSPTLERLAMTTRDRRTLIRAANVSTANMRMTGNILLAIIPFILFVISIRTENFLEQLLYNQRANFIASIGVTVIILGIGSLKKLSNFKP